MQEEIFGPVLHVATFKSDEIDKVINDINATGYGLTFGLHTRIDDRVQHIVDRIHAGNIYVNRNQIGAIVGSQPFGGEGLSGTGPKAGGPHYVPRFYKPATSCLNPQTTDNASPELANTDDINAILDSLEPNPSQQLEGREWLLPGPTGESNILSIHPTGRVLVIANNVAACQALCETALNAGCAVLALCSEKIDTTELSDDRPQNSMAFIHARIDTAQIKELHNIDAVAFAGTPADAIELKQAMASRDERILPLITHSGDTMRFCVERHVCIDTTAAGGNATLLASAE